MQKEVLSRWEKLHRLPLIGNGDSGFTLSTLGEEHLHQPRTELVIPVLFSLRKDLSG